MFAENGLICGPFCQMKIFQGVGGLGLFSFDKFLKGWEGGGALRKLHRNMENPGEWGRGGGVLCEFSSVVGVWIFSGPTQFMMMHLKQYDTLVSLNV